MPMLSTRLDKLKESHRRTPGPKTAARLLTVKLLPPPENKLHWQDFRYKYNLRDAGAPNPRPNDAIWRVINATIRELERDDMAMAAAGIHVWSNVTDAPNLWPVTKENRRLRHKLYAFMPEYNEFPMTVPVRLSNRSKYPTADTIVVKYKGQWQPLLQWLRYIPSKYKILEYDSEAPMIAQQKWWARNGQDFDLIALPTELRLEIYRQAIVMPIYPQVADTNNGMGPRVLLNSRVSGFYHYWRDNPNWEIFRVNKKVRSEALSAGWEGTRKHFDRSFNFVEVISCPNPPIGYNWLAKIELKLDITEWFSFFGVLIIPSIHIFEDESLGPLLQGIETLTDLRLVIDSRTLTPNPWKGFAYRNREEE